MPRAKDRFFAAILVCGSIFVTICAFEIGFRVARGINSRFAEGIYTYGDLKLMVGDYFRPSAFNPFELRPGYRGTSYSNGPVMGRVPVTINSVGLRGYEITVQKPRGVKRVLILGDSFTFGLYEGDTQTYPAVLERLLRRDHLDVQVLNGAYAGGFCPDENLSWLINRGLQFHPDLIILGFFAATRISCLSDVVDGTVKWVTVDAHGFPTSISNRSEYVDDFGRVRSRRAGYYVVGSEPIYRIPVIRNLYSAVLISKAVGKVAALMGLTKPKPLTDSRDPLAYQFVLLRHSTPAMKAQERRFWFVLDGMNSVAIEHHAKFMVIMLPASFQVDESLLSKKLDPVIYGHQGVNRNYFEEMKPLLRKRGIPYVDVFEAMKASPGARYYPDDGEVHMNSVGLEFTARTIEPMARSLLERQ